MSLEIIAVLAAYYGRLPLPPWFPNEERRRLLVALETLTNFAGFYAHRAESKRMKTGP